MLAFAPPLLGPPGVGFQGGPVLESPEDARLRHRRGGVAVDGFPPAGPIGALPGRFVYAGPVCGAFGHAMAESIHRILPARALFDCRRLLFVDVAGSGLTQGAAGFARLPPALQAALRFLQVAPEEVTVCGEHLAVERLHVAEQGSDLGGGPVPGYLPLLDLFTPLRLAMLAQGVPAAARLYVSRARLTHGGLLLGEGYLAGLLRAAGWRVLYPEIEPLAAQMEAYRRAETILFLEGSACHGVELFGAGALRRVLLLPRRAGNVHVFRAALRPRAAYYAELPAAVLIGGLAVDGQGQILPHMGLSAAPLRRLAEALAAEGEPAWRAARPADYARAARADLGAYLTRHGARAAVARRLREELRRALDAEAGG